MATNYQRGRYVEYKVRDMFTDKGYVCLRSAGSKSAWDLVALGPEEAVLIQVKRSKTGKEFAALEKAFRDSKPDPQNYTRVLAMYSDASKEFSFAVLDPVVTDAHPTLPHNHLHQRRARPHPRVRKLRS